MVINYKQTLINKNANNLIAAIVKKNVNSFIQLVHNNYEIKKMENWQCHFFVN